jgi:hypothetical protein
MRHDETIVVALPIVSLYTNQPWSLLIVIMHAKKIHKSDLLRGVVDAIVLSCTLSASPVAAT